MRPITEREQRSVIKRRKAMFSADTGSEIEMGVGVGGRGPLAPNCGCSSGEGAWLLLTVKVTERGGQCF